MILARHNFLCCHLTHRRQSDVCNLVRRIEKCVLVERTMSKRMDAKPFLSSVLSLLFLLTYQKFFLPRHAVLTATKSVSFSP